MGLDDLSQVFDVLDSQQKGYVTVEEIENFYFTLVDTPPKDELVELVVRKVCGEDVWQVNRSAFLQVLAEIERRQAIENEAFWDFQALDVTGSNHISLSLALLLFREYHGDLFSIAVWNKFLNSREKPDKDVYFDEVRGWLSDIPEDVPPSSQREIVQEEARLDTCQIDSAYRQYIQADTLLDGKEREEERHDHIERSVKRKLNKWRTRGLGAMLEDHDGMGPDDYSQDKSFTSDLVSVKTSDVMALLETKYSTLQDRVLMEFASHACDLDSDKMEVFNKLKKIVSKHGKIHLLDEETSQLLDRVQLPVTVVRVLGELSQDDLQRREEFRRMREELKVEGKNDLETDDHLRNAYQKVVGGGQKCDEILTQLKTRLRMEREAILSSLHNRQEQKQVFSSSQVLMLHYCRLLRQLHLLHGESQLTPAGLAVGLAEREQVYKPAGYDWDRERSEWLAKQRLEARVGRRQVKRSTSSLDLDSLEKAGVVSLQTRLVQEVDHAHYFEREAMIYFLQGYEANSQKQAASAMTPEVRQRKIRTLLTRRQECMNLNNLSTNQDLLLEATALFKEERRLEIEKRTGNVDESTLTTIVLADLQQRQEVEAGRVLQQSLLLSEKELRRTILTQIEAKQDQLFPNIAFVTLGGLEVSAEDKEFVVTLEAKFKAMRDQVLVFGLIEQMGSGYKSLSKDQKQKEIYKQRTEEKKLRGLGKLSQMDQLIGPRSQALPSLSTLIGLDKLFPNVESCRSSKVESVNLLADLTSRFEVEQESLLLWLQAPETKALPSKAKWMQMTRMAGEKFLAVSETSHDSALMAVGLLERISSHRSQADKELQKGLAEKRSSLRKAAQLNGEKLRTPPEEKITPQDDDVRQLQAVLVRSMLRRHFQERETMLSILQDPSLEDLVEAAGVMSPGSSLKRLRELKVKWDALDKNDPGNKDEKIDVMEEAGAIRAACKMLTHGQEVGRKVLLGEVCPLLLAELQDAQDAEIARLFTALPDMTTEALSERTDIDVMARTYRHNQLVMDVFTRFDAESDESFTKIVKDKYSSLLKLLVAECVSQTHGGADEWNKLSVKQQEKATSDLWQKAAALWEAGNMSSLSSWVDVSFCIKPSFIYLSGPDRHRYRQRLLDTDPGSTVKEEGSVTADSNSGPDTVCDLFTRFKAEMEFVQNYVRGMLDEVPSEDDKQLQHNKLLWETTLIASSATFTSAGLITGLGERQTIDMTGRLEHDADRYQLLSEQIVSRKQTGSNITLKAGKEDNLAQLQALILKTLQAKYLEEWKVIMDLMMSQRFQDVREAASVESQLQRNNRITQLHRQRDGLGLVEKSKQHAILEEAFVVKMESVRQAMTLENKVNKGQDIDDTAVHARLVAELLQFELAEAQVYLEAFAVEDLADLKDNQAAILTEISQGHVTNIAAVVFTGLPSDLSHPIDTDLEQAVKDKYDALRDQLLIQALIDQMGEAEWNRLSELERQRLLLELKLKERRLRREGKYDEAAALLGELGRDDERLKKLLGDAREDHERKLRERLERRKARLAQGMSEEECDELERQEIIEEEEEEKEKKRNILLYLDHCSEQEKADLLRRLSQMDNDHERARQRQLELVRQRREERRLRQEGNFDMAAALMATSNDNHNRSKLSKEEEKRRQQELARHRLEMVRRQRQMQGENLVRGESILLSGGDREDGVDQFMMEEGRQDEAVLGLLDLRHLRERNLLIKLLDEHSDGTIRDKARVMMDKDIINKLEESGELFKLWRESETKVHADGEKIIADAVGLCVELKRRELERAGDLDLGTDEDVKVVLLTQVQGLQEAEAAQTMLLLTDASDERVEEILSTEQNRLNKPCYTNMAAVILETQEDWDGLSPPGCDDDDESGDEKAVQALEKKYDAMKDKLLMEALMREMGEADWSRLSELERQKKLVEMRLREKRLRREGRMDEVAELLGSFADDSEKLAQFLGQSAEDQQRRVQEKLALRRRLKEERESQGQIIDEKELDNLVEEEDRKIQRKNILATLDLQFEAEKAALLAALHSQKDRQMREKQRQLEMARLQREQKRLKKEEKFDAAAMIFALGQQNIKTKQDSLASERDKQRQLAIERLEALKKKRAEKQRAETGQGQTQDDLADITDDCAYLQSSLLAGLDQLQATERTLLLDLITKVGATKQKTVISASNTELNEKMSHIQEEHQAWLTKVNKGIAIQTATKVPSKDKSKNLREAEKRQTEHKAILESALQIKLELEGRRLAELRPQLSTSEVKDELSTCALTFLQEQQSKFISQTQESIKNMPVEELRKARETHSMGNQYGIYPSLAPTCFHVCLTSDLADLMQVKDDLHSADLEVMLADEFNSERDELLRKAKSESIDVDAALRRLNDQYEQRKQAMNSDLAKQRAELRERLAKKQEAKDDKAYSLASATSQIFATASANLESSKQAKQAEMGKQESLLQQRLAARKEARQAEKQAKREAAEAEERRLAEEKKSLEGSKEELKRRSSTASLLSRERTVVDISDDQKQAMYDQLVKQERFKHNQITAAQARHEMMLKQKLEKRTHQRDTEVQALFSIGERQKTTLQQFQKGEKERQLAQMQERVTRMRESRSQSPNKRSPLPKK